MPYNNSYYWNARDERKYQAIKHTDYMANKYWKEIEDCVSRSKIYDNTNVYSDVVKSSAGTQHILVPTDTVSALINEKDGVTAVLNFASFTNPGGKFIEGSRAQEESLCHESFLYNVLKEFRNFYAINQSMRNYGLYCNRAIYSPNVVFERDNGYIEADVITCAAPNLSARERYGANYITDEENTKALASRIQFIYNMAAKNGVDTLILGAFGCGVFCQNPEEVASLFMKLDPGCFQKIVFAVPNNMHVENYNAFKKIIK